MCYCFAGAFSSKEKTPEISIHNVVLSLKVLFYTHAFKVSYFSFVRKFRTFLFLEFLILKIEVREKYNDGKFGNHDERNFIRSKIQIK